MKVPRTRLAHLVADKTLKQGVSKKLIQEVAAYLLSERRTSELNSLMRDVQADWAAAGTVDVIASSAYPLSAAVKRDIKAHVKRLYPQAKQIIITEVRDPELIGGVQLDLPNQQLDLSIEAKLNKFKQLTLAGKD